LEKGLSHHGAGGWGSKEVWTGVEIFGKVEKKELETTLRGRQVCLRGVIKPLIRCCSPGTDSRATGAPTMGKGNARRDKRPSLERKRGKVSPETREKVKFQRKKLATRFPHWCFTFLSRLAGQEKRQECLEKRKALKSECPHTLREGEGENALHSAFVK